MSLDATPADFARSFGVGPVAFALLTQLVAEPMKRPIMESAEKAMESGMARMYWRKVSAGMTCAVVMPMRDETGTKV